jgi:hypothetical protein
MLLAEMVSRVMYRAAALHHRGHPTQALEIVLGEQTMLEVAERMADRLKPGTFCGYPLVVDLATPRLMSVRVRRRQSA